MYKAEITLGVMPTRRGMLDLETAAAQKDKFMAVIREIHPDKVKLVDIEDICTRGIIESESHAPRVADKFAREKVDAIFVPFCDFGEEGAVADVLSKFRVPVLIWGARDEAPNSAQKRGRDTQCGMFAATKVLRRYGITYSYIFNVPADSEEFRNGFDRFLRVACVVKDVRGLRIAKIGERPSPFRSVMTNEARLMQRFGIQTVAVAPVMLQMAVQKIVSEGGEELKRQMEDIRSRMNCSALKEEQLERLAALKLAMAAQMEKSNCSVAAIECWPSGVLMQLPSCAMIGELTDMGIPVACETDINGAVTLAILRGAMLGEGAAFLADLTIRHPENDNGELLWHCGPFPYSLKAPGAEACLVGGQQQFELKQGHLTLCRFDDAEDDYYLFAGEADTTTGPATTGTYVWVEVKDWKAWEEKLMFGPYIHHLGGVYHSLYPVLREAARYLGLKFDTVEEKGAKCL